ncbi:hypothetical protein PI125_g11513 [Phytophthora idaei]|nr:hypothetical protein PI125_g11513 [Phytophthora idaei]
MLEAMKTRQDDKYNTMKFYHAEEMSVFVVQNANLSSSRTALNEQTFLQLPSTTR